MDPVDYWPMARKYSVWNVAIAALQFWTPDLETHVQSSTIEQVYNAFFYSTSTHLLCQQSDEILFSHFVTTLSTAFESKLALEDEGYESGSENFNIPTPLRRTSKIHHISSVENVSFDPDPVTPCSTSTRESHYRPVHRYLTFCSSEDDVDSPIDKIPSPNSTLQVQFHTDTLQWPSSKYTLNAHVTLEAEEEEEEEDFQTVPLNDEPWDMEEIPDIPLCIHEHSLPHGLCPHSCPYSKYQATSYYNTLDLSNISKFEDLMTMSSDEDISALDDIGYWKRLWLEMNIHHYMNFQLFLFIHNITAWHLYTVVYNTWITFTMCIWFMNGYC